MEASKPATTQGPAIKARNEALRELSQRYSEEFTQLLNERRAAYGLPETTPAVMKKRKQAESQIKKLEEMGLDASSLRAQLASINW